MKKKNGLKGIKVAVIGASLAALAASAYFFLGPKGKKNRQHAKAWAIKMKGEVVGKLEKAKEISEPLYHEIIDTVAKSYAKEMRAGKSEIAELAKDLKKHWSTISKSAKSVKSEVKKTTDKIKKVARS